MWLQNYDALMDANKKLIRLSLTTKLIGKFIIANGEKRFEGNAGVHGYVIVTVSDNKLKTWGGYFETVGSVVGEISTLVKTNLNRSVDLSIQDVILRNQAAIIQNQQMILENSNPQTTQSP